MPAAPKKRGSSGLKQKARILAPGGAEYTVVFKKGLDQDGVKNGAKLSKKTLYAT